MLSGPGWNLPHASCLTSSLVCVFTHRHLSFPNPLGSILCRAVLLLLFVVTHVGDPKLVVYTTLCRSLKLPINGINAYCSRYPLFLMRSKILIKCVAGDFDPSFVGG